MIFLKIENNKVLQVISAHDRPHGYYEYPEDSDIVTGDDIRFFTGDGVRFTIQDSIDAGLITVGKNQSAIWDNGQYIVKADYTHKKYWVKTSGELKIFELGEEPDATVTDQAPPDPDAVWATDKWEIPVSVTAARARVKRSQLLNESDYLMMPDYPLGTKKSAWETYRKSLRDLPEQAGFPNTITWPTKP